jgi:hypothetical protein
MNQFMRTPTDEDRQIEKELRDVMAQWRDAFGPAKDRHILERIHHPDFVWTGADGSRMDRDAHIAAELESEITNELVELVCRRYGDIAVSVGRARLAGTFRSEQAGQSTLDQINELTANAGSTDIAFTMTWKRESGDWRVLAIHFSLVALGASGAS